MPRATLAGLPAAALFAINKPSGPTCMSMINSIKPLFLDSRLFMNPSDISKLRALKKKGKGKPKGIDIKVGQGGTLDPLAGGVLVIGVGRQGTKALSRFLDCDKEYDATVLLGSATDSYDSEGSIVTRAPWSHITKESIEAVLPRFIGQIEQIPPIYSALKMDGRPLYEYARKGIPLPRPIEKRPVNVYSLDLQTFHHSQQHTELLQQSDPNAGSGPSGSGHGYTPPAKVFTQEQRDALRKMLHSTSAEEEFPLLETSPKEETYPESTPPIFKIRVACSGGTYIRNIAHDMGIALGSAAHIVKLERVKQGDWSLERAVDWEIFQEALKVGETEGSKEDTPSEGVEWREWEEKVINNWEVIEPDPNAGAHFDGRSKKPKEANKPQDNRVGTYPVPSSTTVDAGKGNAADV